MKRLPLVAFVLALVPAISAVAQPACLPNNLPHNARDPGGDAYCLEQYQRNVAHCIGPIDHVVIKCLRGQAKNVTFSIYCMEAPDNHYRCNVSPQAVCQPSTGVGWYWTPGENCSGGY